MPPEALAAATTSATLEAVRKAAANTDAHKKEVCSESHGPMKSNTLRLTWADHCPTTPQALLLSSLSGRWENVPACAAAPLQTWAPDDALRILQPVKGQKVNTWLAWLQAASACLVDALLKAHGGDNSLLLAQLQEAQGIAAGSPSQVSTQACFSAPAALSSASSEGRAIWSPGMQKLQKLQGTSESEH